MLTQNGIAPALSHISRQLLGVHVSVKKINSAFSAWKPAIIGAGAVFAGNGIIKGLMQISTHADKFLDQQAKMIVQGLSLKQVEEARLKAYSNARAVPGSNASKNLETIADLTSIAGFEHAMAMSTKMAQLDALLKNVTGKEGSAYTTARAGELLGVFNDKTTGAFNMSGFSSFMDMVGRSAVATHGKVGPNDWLNFVKQAGPGAANLTDDGMLTQMAIIQAMGGHRAGTATAALNRQFAGGKMTQTVAEELERLGIAGKGDFKFGKRGQVMTTNGAMDDIVNAMQHDPLAMVGLILPKLQAAGFNTNEKLSAEIYRMIGTGPAQREVYEIIRGRNQIAAERDRAKQGLPIGRGMDVMSTQSPITARGATMEALGTLKTAVAEQWEKQLLPVFKATTEFLNNLTKLAIAHPTALKLIGEGLAAIGAALVIGGGVALGIALGTAGGVAAGLAAIAGVVTIVVTNLDKLKGVLTAIPDWISGVLKSLGSLPIIGPLINGGGTDKSHLPPSLFNGDPRKSSGNVYLDKEKVGSILWEHGSSQMANRAITGSSYSDPTMGVTSHGSGFAFA
jgi:hypothetical protein